MHIASAASAARALPATLSAARVVLGPLYVVALATSEHLPLVLAALAAASDFADGRLARRLRATSKRGAVLDVVGDAVFVLCALGALAAQGRLSGLLPAAVALALAGFALARLRAAPPADDGNGFRRGAADRAGHAAGVVNYAVVIVASAAVAGWVDGGWLVPASVAVACLNATPLALRAAGR